MGQKQGVAEVESSLAAEITAGVDAAVLRRKQPDDQGEQNADDQGEQNNDDQVEQNNDDQGEQNADDQGEQNAEPTGNKADEIAPVTISEDILERAVKSGISLKEAKEYPSETLLSAMCDRLEAGRGSQDDAGKSEPSDVGSGEENPFASVPDLDPEVYESDLVKGFAALKELGIAQHKELQELRGQGSKSWLDGKVSEAHSSMKFDAAKEKVLRDKFAAMKAGYKAAGQTVDQETIFMEASTLVLGEELRASKEASKGKTAAKRSGQRIQRPSGNRSSKKGSVADDVAAKLDEKFFSLLMGR